MIDKLTTRSAAVSTGVHLALVAVAWLAAIGSDSETPQPEPPPKGDQAPPPTNQSESGQILIAAEDAAAGAMSAPPPLPPLPAGQHQNAVKLAGVPVIVPQATDRPGTSTSRGSGGSIVSDLRLPESTPDDSTLSSELRSMHTNPATDRASRMRQTAGDHLENRLRDAYRKNWRKYDQAVTNTKIIVQIKVDRRGLVTEASLYGGTGCEELDRLIVNWLKSPGLGLPPIEADVLQRILVRLR